jgi:type II secretory pathway component PulK
MKLFLPTHFENRAANGSVLIIVLWIAIGLVSIALYFANSMSYELRASDNRTAGLTSEQAIEGAARYVSFILANLATNGVVPENTQFSCEAVPVGDAHFWIIGRDPSETPSSDPYFGLIDEGSKLNLNTANTNALSYLPNMTLDFADAIVDWRNTNGLGTMSLNYNALGYEDKHAPFETEDELRLVYGATMDLLAGNDLNGNGILDSNEKNSGNGDVEPGLFEYTTVYSREPNFIPNGGSLTNVNTASLAMFQTLFQNAGVNNARARAQQIYNHIHSPTGGTFKSVFDFCVYCKRNGMSTADFAKIYPYITTSTASYIYGRVNADTASQSVLIALFMGLGIDQSTATSAAQNLFSYRQQNADSGNLNSIAWVVDALGNTSTVVRTLAGGDYITARSYQFTAARAVWPRLSAREIYFRHQRRHAKNYLSPGFVRPRLGAGR